MLKDFTEEWRPILKYEGLYEISSIGRVRRLPGKGSPNGRILKQSLDHPNGYFRVSLHDGHSGVCRKVHHLVAAAFLSLKTPGAQINHDDGNKQNNIPHNLKWVTGSQNIQHAIYNGLFAMGDDRLNSKLTSEIAAYIRISSRNGVELAKEFGVSRMTISLIKRNKIWKHIR